MMRLPFANSYTKRYLIIISILLALLIALLLFYLAISKPSVSKNVAAQKDFQPLFSIYGFQGDLLRRPTGVALDDQGRIYVTDSGKQRIVVFDEEGNYINQHSSLGTGKYAIKDPLSVAVAPNGSIFVLTKTLKKIVKFDSSFKPLHEIKFGEAPLAMTIHKNKLYVTTIGGIMIGDLNGNLITSFGTRGKAPGQFDLPGGIVVGSDDKIYVADSLNYRVQALAKDGSPLWQYGKPIPPDKAMMYQGKDRKFGMPASITLDDNGRLYVVDGLSCELDVLDLKGNFIEKIGDIGHDDGYFYYPDGIAYAGNGRLVLADKFNDRVQVFQVPVSTPATAGTFDWAPYTLLLLIPISVFFVRRSRLHVIAEPDFINQVLSNEKGVDLSHSFKSIIVAQDSLAKVEGSIPQELKIISKPVDAASLASSISKSGIKEEQISSIALAKKTKGKRLLLTASKAVQNEAEKLNIATLTYDEFISSIHDRSLRFGTAKGSV